MSTHRISCCSGPSYPITETYLSGIDIEKFVKKAVLESLSLGKRDFYILDISLKESSLTRGIVQYINKEEIIPKGIRFNFINVVTQSKQKSDYLKDKCRIITFATSSLRELFEGITLESLGFDLIISKEFRKIFKNLVVAKKIYMMLNPERGVFITQGFVLSQPNSLLKMNNVLLRPDSGVIRTDKSTYEWLRTNHLINPFVIFEPLLRTAMIFEKLPLHEAFFTFDTEEAVIEEIAEVVP